MRVSRISGSCATLDEIDAAEVRELYYMTRAECRADSGLYACAHCQSG